jgi:hypothetical protein
MIRMQEAPICCKKAMELKAIGSVHIFYLYTIEGVAYIFQCKICGKFTRKENILR